MYISFFNNCAKNVYVGKSYALPNLKLNDTFLLLQIIAIYSKYCPTYFYLILCRNFTVPSAFEGGLINFCVYSEFRGFRWYIAVKSLKIVYTGLGAARHTHTQRRIYTRVHTYKALTIIKARFVAKPLAACNKAIFHTNVWDALKQRLTHLSRWRWNNSNDKPTIRDSISEGEYTVEKLCSRYL